MVDLPHFNEFAEHATYEIRSAFCGQDGGNAMSSELYFELVDGKVKYSYLALQLQVRPVIDHNYEGVAI